MKKPIHIAPWAVMGMAFWCSSAQAAVFTLNEALSVAYETNPRLEAQRSSLRAQDEDVAKANAGWHPSVSVTGGYGYGRTQSGALGTSDDHPLNTRVTVTQPVFRGGQTIAEISRAEGAGGSWPRPTHPDGGERPSGCRDRLYECGARHRHPAIPAQERGRPERRIGSYPCPGADRDPVAHGRSPVAGAPGGRRGGSRHRGIPACHQPVRLRTCDWPARRDTGGSAICSRSCPNPSNRLSSSPCARIPPWWRHRKM